MLSDLDVFVWLYITHRSPTWSLTIVPLWVTSMFVPQKALCWAHLGSGQRMGMLKTCIYQCWSAVVSLFDIIQVSIMRGLHFLIPVGHGCLTVLLFMI